MSEHSTSTGQGGDEPTATVESGLREYLIFLLGLVPVVIAMLRLVLTAHGDSATLYTLTRTVNIPALVLGTYTRFIGVLGLGLTLPLLLRNRTRAGRARPVRMGPTGWTVLSIVLVCSVACLYPEQILDTTVSGVLPADITRAAAWGAAVYLLAWFLRKRRRWRWAAWIAAHPLEILIVAPTIVLLLWLYLLTNDRMWLPAQVISVHVTADIRSQVQPPSTPAKDTGTVRRADGDWAFAGYVLAQDPGSFTIMTVRGRILVVPSADVTGEAACQFEPDFDPGADRPLIFSLPASRNSAVPRTENPTCQMMISDLANR